MATANEVMKNFVSNLKNSYYSVDYAMDDAVRATSSFGSWHGVINQMVSDCESYNGDGAKFLKEKCGIILDNEDTGAITGADAGGTFVKNAESIVPEEGAAYSPNSSSSIISGLTVNWPTGNLSNTEKAIIANLNTWWIKNSLELVKYSYGISFEGNDASIKEMTVEFVNESSNTLAYVSTSYASGGDWWNTYYTPSSIKLSINMRYFSDVSGSDVNGASSESGLYLDRVIAHEMTHAVVSATMNNSYSFSECFNEGIAELTHGIDDTRKDDILYLAENPRSLYDAIRWDDYSSTDTYAAGYMLLRYFANQASNGLSTEASVNGTTMTLSSNFKGSVWLHGTNIFTGISTYANESIVTIDGSSATSSVILSGNNLDNVIRASSGGSQLFGGWGGNDLLVGGAGSDAFWYLKNLGDDIIENIASNDSIILCGIKLADISGINISNNDIYVTFFEGGSLNVKGGATAGNTFVLDGQGSWKYNNNDNSWYSV